MSVQLAFLGNLGPMEMFLILLIVVIFFGAKKIPELARGLGQGIKEFKKASSDIKQEIEEGVKDIEKK
jgi:sec-independent protein translocase protein TatA